MSTFNTNQPEQFTYENEILQLTVLGGIKLEGLDRMRATLKITLKSSSVPPLRHNLDLYNDTQVEKLIRKTAERLEIGTSLIGASMAELTEELEAWRLGQLKAQQQEVYQSPALTPEEQRVAADFLKEPNLLERTGKLIGQSGVIGEEVNRLLMYLIFTSRKREQPLHIVSLGSSGVGKTHLQEKVGALIPEEDKVEITTLSENAFYYFERRALSHKLILIEDLDGAESSLYPLRELQSKKRIAKTVAHKNSKGETKTLHLIVEGPVSVSGCTTREQIYEDNANRSFLIYLDESPEQDLQIMSYQRKLSAGRVDGQSEKEAVCILRNTQRLLEPIKVINPYAEQLDIPTEVFKPRRTNSHYLQFIEVVTFYQQHQREQKADPATGEVFIETTLEDIAAANQLLKETLLRKSDELSGAVRNYFEQLKNWLKAEGKKQFKNQEARKVLRVSPSQQKRYMVQLQAEGLVLKAQQGKGNQKKGFAYQVINEKEYEALKQRIASVLDEALEKLKPQEACIEPSRNAVQQPQAVRKQKQTASHQPQQGKEQAVR